MTVPTNTLQTYAAVGNREDLSDIIYDINRTDTPGLSSVDKVKATGTKHEWQKYALAAAVGTNFNVEGQDAAQDAATTTTRSFNYCGISDKVAQVSGTQEAVSKAGRKSEMAFQMEAKMKELKRDVETAMLQNVASVAGNSSTARKPAGLQTWIHTNLDKASDGTAPTGDGSDTYTTGTARALLESQVENALALAWSAGGNPSICLANAFQKRKLAAFNGNSTRTQDAAGKKVVNSVDIYIDPLGNTVKIMPDKFAPTDTLLFIDTDAFKFATLRDFFTQQLAITGDSVEKQIQVEWTTEVGNELAHAAVADLLTS